jgi:YD repeat-containing protein
MIDRVVRSRSYEIANDGRQNLFTLHQSAARNDLDVAASIFGETVNFYDGDPAQPDGGAFVGLPFGRLGDYGALVRTETLVLTDAIIQEAYQDAGAAPYLSGEAALAWPAEYPQEFRDRLAGQAGYTHQPGGPGSPYSTGYFASMGNRRYDFHADLAGRGRGLVVGTRDPLGHETTLGYDPFALSPTQVTDPVGLSTQADYDYRARQPRLFTDPNGNRISYSFTPLGLLRTTAVMGKVGEEVGDTETQPGTFYQYDLRAFSDRSQPASVRIDRRIVHLWDGVHAENSRRQQNREPPLTPPEVDAMFPPVLPDGFPEVAAFPDRFLQSRQYTDGFGRSLQMRSQAEDVQFGEATFGDGVLAPQQDDPHVLDEVAGRENIDRQKPNVVVSGWQLYDNKGQVVEKYQPFFDTGWGYTLSTDAKRGQRTTMFYDPRGLTVRTVNPDGSEQLVISGVPHDLERPDDFAPTPWEAYTYDANDNAGRTHSNVALSYRHHWNTPTSTRIDALGRQVQTVARNRAQPAAGSPLPSVTEHRTRSQYDIRGNLLAARDPLDRPALSYVCDLKNQVVRSDRIDAGVQRTVRDAAGNIIEQRDAKGALLLRSYDPLNRVIRVWARDDGNADVTLREHWEYGDGGDPNQPAGERALNRRANRLGKPFHCYDEAGLLTLENYDFKANVLEKVRRVISDAKIRAVFEPPPANWRVQAHRVDWQPPPGETVADHAAALLDEMAFRTSVTYDGLNRVGSLRLPGNVLGVRSVLVPQYNRAGATQSVTLDGETYVSRIGYDANGQRTLVAFANGILSRYAYDPATFRLARLRTESFHQPAALTYQPTGELLQDFV